MGLRSGQCLWSALIIATAISLSACSKTPSNSTSPDNSQQGWHLFASNDLVVVDEDLKPLANAKILIGAELGTIEGNYLVTDADGHAALPAAWTDLQPVTLEAPGYVRATYYAQEPAAHTYRLRPQAGQKFYELNGITTGHNVVDKDGFVDFGLVIPALTRGDMLTFDMSHVISTQMDTITVIGQDLDIPTNVTLPRQRETYMLPLTLEKPGYRLFFNESGVQKVFAANGRFPFKQVVNKLRNNAPFSEVVNDFMILGGGVKDISISKSVTTVDLSVKDFTYNGKTAVTAPNFASDETMLAFGVAPLSEYLIPTDVKRVKAGESLSLTVKDSKALVFSLLKKTADIDSSAPGSDRLSAVLAPAAQSSPQFLPILADPRLASNGDVMVQKIGSARGVHAIGTYAVMSGLQEVTQGKQRRVVAQAVWEVYSKDWLEVVSLPKWPETTPGSAKKRWEVNLIGSLNASQVEPGPAMIKDASHVTHTSLDF